MPRLSPPRVGIIAEDNSDVESASVLLKRIAGVEKVGIRRFTGDGCGKIKRKARSWAEILKAKGCRVLVLIHDLDRHVLGELRAALADAISPCPIDPHLICIPIEEIEAWWLSDPSAIRRALNLPKTPKVKGRPESIASPKELLGRLVKQCSQNKKYYLNTKHNSRIAAELDLATAGRKCQSFREFSEFVSTYIS